MHRKIVRKVLALAFVVLLSVSPSSASWLSDITGIDINIPAGRVNFGPPRPDRIPMMLQNLPKDTAQFFLNPMGSALAFAIRQAREHVRQQGCGPASQQVIDALTPFIPPPVFDGVCWATLRPGFTLDTFAIQDGGNAAITLEDTIVFRDSQSGFDPVLWAHELIHVLQYRRLGVEGFAAIYAGGWKSLEDEAYNFQGFVSSRINVQPGAPTWRNQYYETPADWNPNARIADQEFVQQARLTINPLSCSSTDRVNTVAHIFNNCPIAFRIVVLYGLNLQTGEIIPSPCQGPACVVTPGTYSAFPDPPGFRTVRATAVW